MRTGLLALGVGFIIAGVASSVLTDVSPAAVTMVVLVGMVVLVVGALGPDRVKRLGVNLKDATFQVESHSPDSEKVAEAYQTAGEIARRIIAVTFPRSKVRSMVQSAGLPTQRHDNPAGFDEVLQQFHGLFAQGDWAGALASSFRLLVLAKGDPHAAAEAHLAIGTAYRERSMLAEAESHLSRAVELGTRDAFAFINWGCARQERGDHEAALALFRLAQEVDSTEATAYYNAGVVLERMGRRSEALGQFERAVSLESQYVDAIFHLGSCYLALNEPGAAEERFLSVTRLRPEYADAWFNLGLARAKQDKFEDAEETLETAAKINPHDPDITILLGQVLANHGVSLAQSGNLVEGERHLLRAREVAGPKLDVSAALKLIRQSGTSAT